ncbi:MAG: hypothetical protein FJY88_05715 [Candidatus Eisenbacteria bacterium]|nr:hypothetical protein [Candidatus Eisenbacteria bacterium]
MRPRGVVLFCLMMVGIRIHAAQASDGEIYLNANFNDKALDQQIPHRGAEFGEPYFVDPGAGGYVRAAPMASPSLEIADGSASASCAARFSFLENAGISSGTAVVMARLWFAESPGEIQYRVFLSTSGSGSILLAMLFGNDGKVFVEDMDDDFVEVGQYEIGRAYPIAFSVDMTGHTYDVWFDSQLVLDDAAIGITNEDLVGVTFTIGRDEDLEGLFYVDDIRVTDDPDAVPVIDATWGGLRGLHRSR